MQPIQINDYLNEVVNQLKNADSVYDCQVYGGEFASDDKEFLNKKLPRSGKSFVLVACAGGSETQDTNPARNKEEMEVVFAAYVINMVDRSTESNGYSTQAYENTQKVIELVKNNKFGFQLGKYPNVRSFENVSEHIKNSNQVAVMAVSWTQDMVLGQSQYFK